MCKRRISGEGRNLIYTFLRMGEANELIPLFSHFYRYFFLYKSSSVRKMRKMRIISKINAT